MNQTMTEFFNTTTVGQFLVIVAFTYVVGAFLSGVGAGIYKAVKIIREERRNEQAHG